MPNATRTFYPICYIVGTRTHTTADERNAAHNTRHARSSTHDAIAVASRCNVDLASRVGVGTDFAYLCSRAVLVPATLLSRPKLSWTTSSSIQKIHIYHAYPSCKCPPSGYDHQAYLLPFLCTSTYSQTYTRGVHHRSFRSWHTAVCIEIVSHTARSNLQTTDAALSMS